LFLLRRKYRASTAVLVVRVSSSLLQPVDAINRQHWASNKDGRMPARTRWAKWSRQWAIYVAIAINAGSGGVSPAQDTERSAGAEWIPVTIDQTRVLPDATGSALSLPVLESLALSSNPSIARAEAIVAAARGRALQAGLSPNPEVGIDFQQLGSDGLAEQYGVLIGQEFVQREKLGLDRSIALHEVRRLQGQLAAQRLRVRTDVRIAFVRALRAQRQIELTQQLVDIGRKGIDVAMDLFNAKEVGRADVLQAELEVEAALVLHRNAENRRVAAWQQLAAVTSQMSLTPRPLAGDIANIDEEIQFEAALERMRNQSPEIAATLAAIERSRCNLRRQQIEPRPNVKVGGLINWRDNGIGGGADGGIVVTLPLPIWNKNQGAIREARHQLIAAERTLGQVEFGLMNRLAPVFERYRNAVEQVQRYQQRILPKSAETLELTRSTYELGEISFISLLTAQRTYASNQIAYLDSLEALRVAHAEIDGMLLSGSLQSR
jgi:cobalt-zinc-cadmium efflux system outer membrane protein